MKTKLIGKPKPGGLDGREQFTVTDIDGTQYPTSIQEAVESTGVAPITDIINIPTSELNTALVLKPDGVGGVEWGASGGGGLGAGNGLTENIGTGDMDFGGALIADVLLDISTYDFLLATNASTYSGDRSFIWFPSVGTEKVIIGSESNATGTVQNGTQLAISTVSSSLVVSEYYGYRSSNLTQSPTQIAISVQNLPNTTSIAILDNLISIRTDSLRFLGSIPSGATQGAAGVAAGYHWTTVGHATLPDGTMMVGV